MNNNSLTEFRKYVDDLGLSEKVYVDIYPNNYNYMEPDEVEEELIESYLIVISDDAGEIVKDLFVSKKDFRNTINEEFVKEYDKYIEAGEVKYVIDIAVSYNVNVATLKKHVSNFENLNENEKVEAAIEYVKKHRFNPNDLEYTIADI